MNVGRLPWSSGPGRRTARPAAASFDMFADYEARGRAFKAAVHELARQHPGEAR